MTSSIPRNARSRTAVLLLTSLILNLLPLCSSAASTSQPLESQSSTTPFVRVLNLPVNDIAYDKVSKKLFASIPSVAGPSGNSVTEIDPVTATLGTSVFVGSEPNKIAVSDDGQTVYVGIDGAASVRRVDVASHTATTQFRLGSEPFDGVPFIAADMIVVPGNANAVAVARMQPGLSPPGKGVVVYDNGVARTNIGQSPGNNPIYLSFGATAATLYGSQQFGGNLQKMSVDAAGVTVTGSTSFQFSGELQFESGRLYNDRGQVYNPTNDSIAGTFANSGNGPFVVDATAGRAYFITNAQTHGNNPIILRAYDINSFAAIDEIQISGVLGTPTSFVRWGSNGLAFRTNSNQLFLVQTALIPSPDPVPSPTPTPSPTPSPTPTPSDASVRHVPLVTKDLVYVPSSQSIYATIPSAAGPSGNSITSIDPVTSSVAAPVFVGSEPTKLTLADDGHSIYLGLNGAGSVRRFDTSTQTAGPPFALGVAPSNPIPDGFLIAADLATVPGSPNSVAVSRITSSINPFTSLSVYDDGVKRPNDSNGGGGEIEFSASPTRIYSKTLSFGTGVLRHNVSAAGVSVDGGTGFVGKGGSIKFAGGLIYTSQGSVFDPETSDLKGTFSIGDTGSNPVLMTIDAALGRAYFFVVPSGGRGRIKVFDINTFLEIGETPVEYKTDPVQGLSFEYSSLVRWGQNGLAFRTTSHVTIVQSGLIGPGTFPDPTPTPTPTPTPSPTPQLATFVRTVKLTVNDFVQSRPTEKLYASVPSSVGVGGNSIVEIDPTTSATGAPVFIGSEPTRLAISDNGQVAWASIEGAQAIRRFDVATKTPGLQFSVSSRPSDMEVMPGAPDTIATANTNDSPFIYDSGVQRPHPFIPGGVRPGLLEFSSNPNVLYGFNNGDTGFDFYRMSVGANGISLVSKTEGIVGGGFAGNIRYVAPNIYTSVGEVFNPDTLTPLGVFKGPGAFSSVAVDTTLRRAFFISEGSPMILRAFDLDTFLPVGQVTLPFSGGPGRMERWGVNGLAVKVNNNSSDGKIYLIQSALVSAAAPIPTGVTLTSSALTVNEGSSFIDLSVIRTGDLSGSSTVDYATADGTASERTDYTTAIGTLRFAPGESSKTVRVFITGDVFQENNETFTFTLSNSSGAEITSPEIETVTIQDNDFSPPQSNPIDNTTFFVRQHYRDFLNRNPDTPGLIFWSNEIESCGADAQCREIKRINVSAAFFLSIEFQNTGYLVYRLHQSSFATGETLAMTSFLKDTQDIGQGVIVGAAGWEQLLETNKRDFLNRFVARPQFTTAYPLSMTPAQFVDALNANTKDPEQPSSGGSLTQTERDQLVADLTNGTKTRAEILRAVAENTLFSQRQFNRAFVYMQYVGYLRRNPNASPDSDFSGYNFWLQKLKDFNGNFVTAEMVKAFISSSEYRQRFGP